MKTQIKAGNEALEEIKRAASKKWVNALTALRAAQNDGSPVETLTVLKDAVTKARIVEERVEKTIHAFYSMQWAVKDMEK